MEPSRRPRAEADATTAAGFAELRRRRGIRVTAQRLAVYAALARDRSHPTAEAVYARLRPAMPSLSPATVYRILDSLEGAGLVRRVSTTDGAARFDANLTAHQHAVCRVCGRIDDVHLPSLDALRLGRLAVPGFTAEGLDVHIVGRCSACRRRKSS